MPTTTGLKTRDLEGIEVLDVGTWDASTGKVKVTDEFLDELVENTNELLELGLLAPPAKLGHPKQQKLLQQEGWPAAGWIKQLYRDGTKVLADVEKVPEKLADLIEAKSYRKVSAEFWKEFGQIAGKGKSYGPVLTAIAFLGEELPAVSNLGDMLGLFERPGMKQAVVALSSRTDSTVIEFEKGKAQEDKDEVDPSDLLREAEEFVERAAAGTKGKKGAPRLRAFLDEIRRRVRDIVGKSEAELGDDESLQERTRKIDEALRKRYGYSAWVMETYDDYAIVDREGRYYQVAYTIAEDGSLQLGEETEVQRSWKVAAAAAKHSFDVAGGEPEWAEVDQEDLPAEAFAIAEDAEDRETWRFAHHHEQEGVLYAHAGGIRAALTAAAAAKDVPASALAHLKDHARRAGIGDDEKEEAGMANAAVAKQLGLPEDADDAAILAKISELQQGQAELTRSKEQELARAAEGKVDEAIKARKIRPAEKTFWVELAREKPEKFDEHVAKLPVLFSTEIGTAADAPDQSAAEQLNRLANERIAEQAKAGVKLAFRDAIKQVSGEQPELARAVVLERRGRASAAAAAS